MNKTDELKALLDRLKGEVGHIPDSGPQPGPPPVRRPGPAPAVPVFRPERFGPAAGSGRGMGMPPRPLFPPQERAPAAPAENIIWSENKEAMLFGVLSSLVALLGGILAAREWLILIGAAAFALFSLIMFLALFGHYLNFRGKSSGGSELAARLDALSRKVESLAKAVGDCPHLPASLKASGRMGTVPESTNPRIDES